MAFGGTGQGSLPDDFLREPAPVRDEVLYRISYQGYLAREQRQIERLAAIEKIRIPTHLNFMDIRGLRREAP